MSWCTACKTRRADGELCVACSAGGHAGCSVCGSPVRSGAQRCALHSSASVHSSGADRAQGSLHRHPNRTSPARSLTASTPPADAARWAVALALPPPPGPHAGRLKRVTKWIGLLAATGIVAVAYRAALPSLVAGQRPTLLPKASAPLPSTGAGRSPSAVAWDLVDVALFLDSCGTSMPADVCQCEVSRLPAYYRPEVALSLADRSAGKVSPLPENYRNVAMACSAG